MLLNSTLAIKKLINNSKNPALLKIYTNYSNVNKKISYAITESNTAINIDSLINISNKIEKEMISMVQLENQISQNNVQFDEIRNSLSENEAVIEFVNFNYYNNGWTDSTFYCALVIKKELEHPEIVYLFEEKQMKKLLYRNPELDKKYADKNPEYYYVKSLYQNKKNQVDISDSIYQITWKPIDYLLKNVKNVYISPSGILNQIAFDAIPYNDSLILSDVYSIDYVSNSSKIKSKKSLNFSDIKDVALFGGIQYDMDTTMMKIVAGKYQKPDDIFISSISSSRSINLDSNITSRGVVWQNLEDTIAETENIETLFSNKNISTKLFSGTEATEEVFKSFSNNSPTVMHIATHGFYFPEDNKFKNSDLFSENLQFTNSKDPLMRSGILLAGGNKVWTGGKIPDNIQDGVLSAYEVSQLNLLNTKLVVLSACQTGLGDFVGNEGVYGLQRAFKIAGVDYLIVSLWQVPDATTQELMQDFYKYWLQGSPINQAFKLAQNDLKKKYSAYGWAAFVLIY